MRNLAARILSHADSMGSRIDAGEGATYARQLEYIQSRVYQRKYAGLIARTLFPQDSDPGPPEAYNKTWRLEDSFGATAQIHDYSKDFPNVEIMGEEVTRKIFGWGVSYTYSFFDLKRAAMAKTNLEERKANAARRAMEEQLEKIAYNGGGSNLPGVMNTPNCLTTAPAAAGLWSGKTGAQVIADAQAAIAAQSLANNGTYEITDLLIDTASYNAIRFLRYLPTGETNAPKTVLKYIQEDLGVTVTQWKMLDIDAAASAPKKVFYTRDEDVIAFAIQQDFLQEAPCLQNLAVQMPCHIRTSGVEIRQPKGVTIMSV